ncbi:hypothetical protein Mgra_00006548, partial [Meloidogyne graminicola]
MKLMKIKTNCLKNMDLYLVLEENVVMLLEI